MKTTGKQTASSPRAQSGGPVIARLCGAIEADLDEFSSRVTDRVRAEIPSFSRLPFAEQQQHHRKLIAMILAALAVNAGPSEEQLRYVRSSARRRVLYGLSVADVLATLQVFSLEFWNQLRSESSGPADAEAITEILSLHWLWMQALSGTVAEVYAEEMSLRKGREVSLRHRLLETLRGGGETFEQAIEAARELGFDPNGSYQAVCAAAELWPQEQIAQLQGSLAQLPGVVHCGLRDKLFIVLAQDIEPTQISARIERFSPERFGLGLPRLGLAGAEMSISDAALALSLAGEESTGMVSLEERWLEASLSTSVERLAPLLAKGRMVAADHPHLAETVRAFASSRFSLSAAAGRLVVHPNTAAYRLARWEELTGWDARTLDGLLLSVVALEAFPAGGGEA